jgi:5-methylcytosine-specific restriction enzyme subunit McrC
MNKLIQVFEHDQLLIGQGGFKEQHWRDLAVYNEEKGGKYFRLLPNGVKFNQYVGVIQVGNLTIEILPKIGKTAEGETEKKKWQGVLIDMLQECRWLNFNITEKASLRLKPNSILEAYLQIFVSECQSLVRQGLIKKYRIVEENGASLKGKLLIQKQIQHNYIHRERFYTSHVSYDRQNSYNQILYKAIKCVSELSKGPHLKEQVNELMLSFPDLDDIKVTKADFDRLQFDRKTHHYREALQIAFMLLLNYRPDIVSGTSNILAILFNMNDLWEEYIAVQIRKHLKDGWEIGLQKQKVFWSLNESSEEKIIKSDIVVKHSNKKVVIIDTKWKLPDDKIPSDDDLKQMYVYNHHWKSSNSILLYPKHKYEEKVTLHRGTYKLYSEGCSMVKVSVLNQTEEGLDLKLGVRIVSLLDNLCSGN